MRNPVKWNGDLQNPKPPKGGKGKVGPCLFAFLVVSWTLAVAFLAWYVLIYSAR